MRISEIFSYKSFNRINIADIDECASSLCQYLGTCIDEVNGYNCTCVAGYTGIHCETGKWKCGQVDLPIYFLTFYQFDTTYHDSTVPTIGYHTI